MKPRTKWTLIALSLALLAGGLYRAMSKRNAQQEAVAAIANTKSQTVVELADTDVTSAQVRELTQGLAISGALRAANSAVVKARVAGELQALTVREGDAVQAGQILARIEPTEYQARLAQAKEQADAAKAQIDIAKRQYDNNKALVNQGFISQTALETSEASLQSAKATYLAAQSAADVARKAMDDTVLRAPVSGRISQRLAQPGERVAIDTRILEIVDLSRIELEAALSSADAADVRVGQGATLSVEGIATPVQAKVARINPSTQPGSRSVLVYLSVIPVEGLRQGVFAQGELHTAKTSVLSVPLSAVRTEKPDPYVQVVENNTVVHRVVKTLARGQIQNESMIGIDGAPANAVIIRGSVGPLRAGIAVRFTSRAPQAPASAASAAAKAGA